MKRRRSEEKTWTSARDGDDVPQARIEALKRQAETWLNNTELARNQARKEQPENLEWKTSQGYLHLVQHLLIGDNAPVKDPEIEFEEQLRKDQQAKLRYVMERTPAESNFAKLSYAKLSKALDFSKEPKKKREKSAPVSTSGELSKEARLDFSMGNTSPAPAAVSEADLVTKHRKEAGKASIESEANLHDHLSGDEHSDEEIGTQNEMQMRLRQELIKAVESMIKVKWAKTVKGHADAFKEMGFPHGNPFAVPLKQGEDWLPSSYFEQIKEPLDLTTIKDRVHNLFYSDIAMFERDTRLVYSNALKFNCDAGDPLNKMAKQQKKAIEDNLKKARRNLGL